MKNNKIQLIEIGENSYKLTGIVKNEATGNEENVEEYSEPHFRNYTIEVKCLGLTYNVMVFYQLHDRFADSLVSLYYEERLEKLEKLSEDITINLYQILFEEGKLDKRIIDLTTVHSTHSMDIRIYKFKDKLAVPVRCLTYGFNNKLYVYIELSAFLDLVKNGAVINDIKYYELIFENKYCVYSLKDAKEVDLIETILTTEKIRELNKDISSLENEIESIEERKEQVAIDYYKNKYPNLKDIKDNSFVIVDDGSVCRIRISVYKKNRDRWEQESLESFYSLIINGVNIGETGEHKSKRYIDEESSLKLICSQSEYQELLKKHGLPVKLKKSYLIKLYNLLQRELLKETI